MPTEYQFPANPWSCDHKLFPSELEEDKSVFFHGTSCKAAKSIVETGFKIPKKGLTSISFTSGSGLALNYACKSRSELSPEGCIIAVRINLSERKGVKNENGILHDYCLDPQPEIIGYCVVPADYTFI